MNVRILDRRRFPFAQRRTGSANDALGRNGGEIFLLHPDTPNQILETPYTQFFLAKQCFQFVFDAVLPRTGRIGQSRAMDEYDPAAAFCYRLCGITVSSPVPLPARTGVPHGVSVPIDVHMEVGAVPAALARVERHGANWSLNAREFLLDLPEIGRFLAADGARMTLQPAHGVALDDVLVFATGTLLSAILYQRGALLLHGSAVVRDGKAFLFCGASGAGKSTLAGALSRAGCTFLSDDMCSITQREGAPPFVEPDGRTLRLFGDSIARLGLDEAVGARVRRQIDKYHVGAAAQDMEPARVPLGGIYLLSDADAVRAAGIFPLPALVAAQALLRQFYRRRIALAYATQGAPAARTAALLSHAGVYELRRPRDLARLDETVDALIAHWTSLSDA